MSNEETLNIKIWRICDQLDEELNARPKVNRKIVATMYYLAAQRIKHAFGMNTPPLINGQRESYALSGFKRPINQLIDIAKSGDAQAEESRRLLIQFCHHFEKRYFEITHLKLLNSETLPDTAELAEDEVPRYYQ